MKIFMVHEGKLDLINKSVFSTGDAYLVVDESDKTIYVWLGSKCSTDEKGTAAVEARRIDDGKVFHGTAKITTYDEGDESPEFLAKIKGLKIVDKNLAKSMLKDVKTGEFAGQSEHVLALYRISSEEYKGLNAMKYKQVPFKKDSLNGEDCFLADLGVDLWIWQGATSSVKEKVKSMQYARQFDADRSGDQKPRVFIENEDDEDFLKIFEGILPKQDRETIDFKVEKFEISGAPQQAQPQKKSIPKIKKKGSSKSPVKTDDNGIYIQKGSGRLTCPKCGNLKPSMIREVEDKTNIIMDYPLLYGKKFICGKCGCEWKRID